MDYRFLFHLQLWGWLKPNLRTPDIVEQFSFPVEHFPCRTLSSVPLKVVVFIERQNRFKGGILGSLSINLMDIWTIDFFPENHRGRCTTIPISLVQIWVLHLGGFPVCCLEISLKLAENHTSSCVL